MVGGWGTRASGGTGEACPGACDGGRTRGLFRKSASAPSAGRPLSEARTASTSARRTPSPAQAASRKAARSVAGSSAACSNSSRTRASRPSAIAPSLAPRRRVAAQALSQPGAGEAPVALDRTQRRADDFGGFLNAQAGVVAEQNDLCQARVLLLELLYSLVKGQHVLRGWLDYGQSFGQLDAPAVSAVFDGG